jgi:acetyltransferase-like isoleucine patch superfamily enzyme
MSTESIEREREPISLAITGSRLHQLLHALRMVLRSVVNRATSRFRDRGRRNSVVTRGAVLRGCVIEIRGDDNSIEIMPNARLLGTRIRVQGSRHRLWIGRDACDRGGGFAFHNDGGTVRVGSRSSFYGVEIGVTEGGRVEIGEDCLFSNSVEIRNGDSHSIIDGSTKERINPAEDVTIGDHVWLGTRVLVLKGSRIGSGSVVGAASVVTGELPENSLGLGSPAKLVRGNIRWDRELL